MNTGNPLLVRFRVEFQSIMLFGVLAIHGGLLAWIALINAPVFDEIAHLPSGLAHWHYRNFGLYSVNPPLMRMIASVPLLLVSPKTDWISIPDDAYSRPEFVVGSNFMVANMFDSFWYFTLCRWAQIPVPPITDDDRNAAARSIELTAQAIPDFVRESYRDTPPEIKNTLAEKIVSDLHERWGPR